MKSKLLFSKALAILSLSVLLVGCSTSVTLSKKRYSDGYYVNIVKKDKAIQEVSTTLNSLKNDLTPTSKEVKIQSNDVAAVAVNAEEIALKNIAVQISKTQTTTIPEIKNVSFVSEKEVLKTSKKTTKFKKQKAADISDNAILLYILAILIPWLAVGIVTDWDLLPTLITFLLWASVALWILALIYALIKVNEAV